MLSKSIAIILLVSFLSSFLYGFSLAAPLNLLEKYETGNKQFKEVQIGNKIVYYYLRKIGDATVEKDYIVYQFDKNTKELIVKKTHWRDDLPEKLPEIRITKDQAESIVKGEVLFSKLYIISPESDAFPIVPTPENPCWAVRSTNQGNLIMTVVDAVEGSILGYGIPPPYTAFSFSGPIYFDPCSDSWNEWYQNAETWFNAMGYSTEAVEWPSQTKVQNHIQSNQTAMFYELAHGGSGWFISGCVNGNSGEYTTSFEIEDWIADYPKMPFAFIGSCEGMCDTTDDRFSYEFRKGSSENTVTVGYCHMDQSICDDCWTQSIDWQNTLFDYMNQGYSVKYAFDQAGTDYPACSAPGCMRFAGDTDFAVVPIISRISIECGDTITQDAVLNHDLLDCPGNGIILDADGITLEGNGHIIDGTGSGTGIYINDKHNLTIKNCMIREFTSGIDLLFSSNDTLMNNVVYNNSFAGIYLNSSSQNVFINNTVNNNNHGISLLANCDNNTFTNNIVHSNQLNGINLSDTSRFNLFWNNSLINNVIENAYEDIVSTDNNWNLADTGNFWSDCETNPGYPDYYEIPGSGDGADFYPQCIHPPDSFSLISPQDSALVPPDITFDWEDAEDPEDDTVWYDLYISASSGFHTDSTVVFDSLLNSNYLDTLEIGGFYWKVRAYDKWGLEAWSTQTWSFNVTNNPPGSFSLLLPEDSAFVHPGITLDWEDAEDPDPWDPVVWYDLYISTSSDFHPDSTVIHNSLLNSNYSDTLDIEIFYWKARAYDRWGAETWSTQTWSLSVFLNGDANGDGETTIADVVYIVNYAFKSGPAPEPIQSADVNCDEVANIVDAVYLVNYLFRGGSPPGDPNNDGIPDC